MHACQHTRASPARMHACMQVCSINGQRMEVFIDKYHLRGSIALTLRSAQGAPQPRLPARAREEEDVDAAKDSFAAMARRGLR